MKVRDVMRTEVVTVDVLEDALKALQIMFWRSIRHLPVMEGDCVVGLLSERDILAGWPEGAPSFEVGGQVRDLMSAPAHQVSPNADIADAAATMSVHGLGSVPVIEAGKLVGIVTSTDLMANMAQYEVKPPVVGPQTTVAQVMTRSLVAVHADHPIFDVAGLMVQHGVRHVPVIDGLQRVVGIVSDRDVRSAVGNPMDAFDEGEKAARLREMRVSHVMTSEPRTLSQDDLMAHAASILLEDKVGAIPVVDVQERLVGILSYIDVLRMAAARTA